MIYFPKMIIFTSFIIILHLDTQTRHIKIHTVNVRQISTLHVERFSQIGKIQGC